MADCLKISYYSDSGIVTRTFDNDTVIRFEEVYSQITNIDQLTSRKRIIYYRGDETIIFIVYLKQLKPEIEEYVNEIFQVDDFIDLKLLYHNGTTAEQWTVKVDQNGKINYQHGGISREEIIQIVFYRISPIGNIAVMIPSQHMVGI